MSGARGNVFPVFKEFEDFATFPREATVVAPPSAASLRDVRDPQKVQEVFGYVSKHQIHRRASCPKQQSDLD